MFQENLTPILTKNEHMTREVWKITYLTQFLITFLFSLAMIGWKYYMINTGKLAADNQFAHPVLIGVMMLSILLWNYFFYKKTYQQYGFWLLAIGALFNLSQFLFIPFVHQTELYRIELTNTLLYFHFNPHVITAIMGFMQILNVLHLILSAFLLRINWKYQKGLDKIEKTFVNRQVGEEPNVILVNKK